MMKNNTHHIEVLKSINFLCYLQLAMRMCCAAKLSGLGSTGHRHIHSIGNAAAALAISVARAWRIGMLLF